MDFLRYFQSLKSEMVRLLKNLVQLESPTSEKSRSIDAVPKF